MPYSDPQKKRMADQRRYATNREFILAMRRDHYRRNRDRILRQAKERYRRKFQKERKKK